MADPKTPETPEVEETTDAVLDTLGLPDEGEPSPDEGEPTVQDTTATLPDGTQLSQEAETAQPEPASLPPRNEQGQFAPQGEAQPDPNAAPEPEPAPAQEVDWQQRAIDAESRLTRQRQGFQRTIGGLREQQRQQPLVDPMQQQQPAQQQPPQDPRLPIEFDDQGQPYVPASALGQVLQQQQAQHAPPPPSPENLRRTRLGQIQQAFINTDPVANAAPTNAVFSAVEDAHVLLSAKQAEMGNVPLRTPEEMVEFMEETGVGETLRQQYPWLTDERDVETLIEATVTMNPRKFGRLVSNARGAQQPTPQPTTPGAPPRVRQLPPSKPRSQATRGGPQTDDTNKEQRLAYLDAKDPMDLTEAETKELEGYLRTG